MEFWSTGALEMASARGAEYGIGHRPKLCVQVFPSTPMCRKCLSFNTPALPYSNAPWYDCGFDARRLRTY